MKTLVLASLIAGGSLLSVGAAPASAATTSTCGTLPAVVQGNPMVKPMQNGVAYLYHGSHGWGLRVTHAGSRKIVVTGTIKVTKAISNVRTFHLERGDAIAVSKDGRLASFRMTNVGHLDGFDFSAECSKDLTLSVKVDGHEVPTTKVYLGSHRVHPTSVPVTIERH